MCCYEGSILRFKDIIWRCLLFNDGIWRCLFSKESIFWSLTSFLPRLYLHRGVQWTSEEWKWWYRASRRETWKPPATEENQIYALEKPFHLKKGVVEENSASFSLADRVLGSLHVGQLDEDCVQRPRDDHEDRHDDKLCVIPHSVNFLSIAEIIRGLRIIQTHL